MSAPNTEAAPPPNLQSWLRVCSTFSAITTELLKFVVVSRSYGARKMCHCTFSGGAESPLRVSMLERGFFGNTAPIENAAEAPVTFRRFLWNM